MALVVAKHVNDGVKIISLSISKPGQLNALPGFCSNLIAKVKPDVAEFNVNKYGLPIYSINLVYLE